MFNRNNKYIDIYAGCGGLSWGLHQAGWTGLFAVEKSIDAFSTFRVNLIDNANSFNWPDWLALENHNINDLLVSKIDNIESLKGTISLVAGGPPCQGFSMAGKRKFTDYRNKQVSSYLRFIYIVRPKIVFFENVHGFTISFNKGDISKKNTPYSDKIAESLKRMGYNIHWKLIDVSLYGVPQKRTRFILVGSLEKDPQLFFSALEKRRLSFLQEKGINEVITVHQAIDDLRKAHGEDDCPDSKGFKSGLYGEANSAYQCLMRSNVSTKLKIPNSHRFAQHRSDTKILFNRIMQVSNTPKRISPSQNIVEGLKKRGITPLKPNYQCNTVTSIPDDYIHYSEPRVLTVREMARIQGFPDCFEFKGKYTTGGKLRRIDVPRYTQVANAIPPIFSEQVGHALKELL